MCGAVTMVPTVMCTRTHIVEERGHLTRPRHTGKNRNGEMVDTNGPDCGHRFTLHTHVKPPHCTHKIQRHMRIKSQKN